MSAPRFPLEDNRYRYENDSTFHTMVDLLQGVIMRLELSPAEVRACAMYACFLVEMRKPMAPIPMAHGEVEEALRDLHHRNLEASVCVACTEDRAKVTVLEAERNEAIKVRDVAIGQFRLAREANAHLRTELAALRAPAEPWDPAEWDGDCTRCHGTIAWDGDEPVSVDDAICFDCVWKELDELRLRKPAEPAAWSDELLDMVVKRIGGATKDEPSSAIAKSVADLARAYTVLAAGREVKK